MDEHIERLTKLFMRFPGIGERQARRFAYFVLTQPQSYVQTLSQMLVTARGHAHTCTRCHRIYEGDPGMCSICSNPLRDQSIIVTVEKSSDIDSFAKTEYNGLFFVLGGLIPIMQKDIVEGTNAHHLVQRAKEETSQGVLKEIILAFPLTPNGEHTDEAIRELLAESTAQGLLVTSLGRGLSTGAELEYADAASLSASLKKRE
jgi:recombination protein RecR